MDDHAHPGTDFTWTTASIQETLSENLWLYICIILCITTLLTRLTTSNIFHPSKPIGPKNGTEVKTIPTVPYWFPLIGHLPNMAWDADGFVKSLRTKYNQGIFAFNFGGTTHNVMYTPGLATALLNEKPDKVDAEEVTDGLLQTIFGLPASDVGRYKESRSEIMACYKHLLTEPSLGGMVEKTVRRVRENVRDLVTFASSPVDQPQWERTSNVTLTKNRAGEEVVEASLLPLIRDFCAHTANPTIMGSDFLTNFPNFFDDIWTLDRGFLLLASGLPRWVPIPTLTRAHIARKRILESVCVFHSALEKDANGEDPGISWRNLDDVGTLVRARLEVYRKYNWSIRARAAIEHSLMWAANANSNALVFWMLNRIYASPSLLTTLRSEIAPYASAVQPEQSLAFPEAPRLEIFDVEALCAKCPLLKSVYIESLRVDTASWSFKVVKRDFAIQARGEKDAPQQAWLLRKGEYAHAAHDLHNTDPKFFEQPMVWRADRHVRYDGEAEEKEKKGGVADMGSIRPYGGGASMCKGRAFAFKECMAFVAAIIALWDIEPAGGGEWKMPRHRKATGVYGTADDTRVWVKRRKLPAT